MSANVETDTLCTYHIDMIGYNQHAPPCGLACFLATLWNEYPSNVNAFMMNISASLEERKVSVSASIFVLYSSTRFVMILVLFLTDRQFTTHIFSFFR